MNRSNAIKSMLILLTLLILSACSSTGRHLYYHETSPEEKQAFDIDGSLPLVSIQVSGRTLTWSEGGGNVVTTYSFSFDNANTFANMVFEYLPLKELGIQIPAQLRNKQVDLTDYLDYKAWIQNTSYDWGVPIVDQKQQPDTMDSKILTCLNEEVGAEQYLVLDADIIEYQRSNWFGLIPFRLVYEFSAVVYNDEGAKIFSKHYRHRLKRKPGSVYEAQFYYDGLEVALEQVKKEIIADLEQLGAASSENAQSFSKGAI